MKGTEYTPVKWGDEAQKCCERSDWRQSMFPNDILTAQLEIGACETAQEEITATNFDPPSSWTYQNDFGVNQPFPGPFINLRDGWKAFTNIGLTEGDWAEITIDVVYPTESVLNPDATGVLRKNKVVILGFENPIEFFSSTGQFTFFARWGSGSVLTITRQDVSFNIVTGLDISRTRITGVSVKAIANPAVRTIDLKGNTIDGTTSANINVEREYPYMNIYYLPTNEAIAAGCFRLRATQRCAGIDIDIDSEIITVIPENECSVRITGCGNNTTFQGDFQPVIRLEGILVDDGNESDREIYRSSLGVHSLAYGRFQQAFKLLIERIPEHIRKFIYTLGNFETIAIQEGTSTPAEYFALEAPEKMPFTQGDQILAQMEVRLVRKGELNEAIFSQVCGVNFPPFVLGSRAVNTAISDSTTTPDTLINAQ